MHRPNLIHVKVNDRDRSASNIYGLINDKLDEVIRPFDKLGWGVIKVVPEADIFEFIEKLNEQSDVIIAEPLYVGFAGNIPNDDDFNLQWPLRNTGQSPTNGSDGADIRAIGAWELTTGSSDVVVAVLDSGIPIENGNLSHPDLQNTNRIILGENFIDPQGPLGVRDDHGHGTHVAGIIGAETNNNDGIAGVAGDISLLIIKTNDINASWSDETFYQGVIYAADFSDSTGRRVVVNFSSGSLFDSQSLKDAIEYAAARDVLIVSITHNNVVWEDNIHYPAKYADIYDNVIAVGATNHHDNRASYSIAGPEITLVAPGGHGGDGAGDVRNVYSTMPNYSVTANNEGYNQNYDYMPGTSQAAPHVAGVAALMLSIDDSLLPLEIRSILENTADKVSGMNGHFFTDEYGHGRLNAADAVGYASVLAGGEGALGHSGSFIFHET